MKVNVGSKNNNKVLAVKEAFADFPELDSIEITAIEVDTGVHKQPKSMEETVAGAINRAKNAFQECDLSIGLESGLIKVPHTKSGYMDVTMCAIYDGKKFHLGGSPIFEYPKAMVDLLFTKDYEIDDAAKEIGFTDHNNIGKREGVIGALTKGKMNRKEYTKLAVFMALVHLLNPKHY